MTTEVDISKLAPRFRWGNIAPRANKAIDLGPGYEFYQIVPLDIIEIKVELGITDYTPDAVELAIDRFWDRVGLLQREQVDRIILGGAPVSAQLGRARVRDLLDQGEAKTNIAFDAPLEAVITSMRHLGATRLALASRWSNELNTKVAAYLADGGIEVVAMTDRGQWAGAASAMTFEEGLRLALEVAREAASAGTEAEAVFVAGGSANSLPVIPVVEAESGKTVFTNFSAEVFTGLVAPGIIDPLEGWGRLLAGG